MITKDDLAKIYKFARDESAHHYRCEMKTTGRDMTYHRGSRMAYDQMASKIFELIEREALDEGEPKEEREAEE